MFSHHNKPMSIAAKPIAPCDESSHSSRLQPGSSRQNTYRGDVDDCKARSHRAPLPDGEENNFPEHIAFASSSVQKFDITRSNVEVDSLSDISDIEVEDRACQSWVTGDDCGTFESLDDRTSAWNSDGSGSLQGISSWQPSAEDLDSESSEEEDDLFAQDGTLSVVGIDLRISPEYMSPPAPSTPVLQLAEPAQVITLSISSDNIRF